MMLNISPKTKGVVAATAAAATVASIIGWIKFQNNWNTYRWQSRERARRDRARRKGKQVQDEPYQEFCQQFVEDWNGEGMVTTLEADLFPRGGSYASFKVNMDQNNLLPEQVVKAISFAGGGFRTISYVGMLVYLEKRGMIKAGETRFYGASLGALIAAGMIIGEAYPKARDLLIGGMLEYVCEVHADWAGMWGICGPVCREVLNRSLPDDVSNLNGRLFVTVTVLWPYPHCKLVTQFDSKQDLIETLLASQFIPGWTHGLFPFKLWRGLPAIDGGVLDNIPTPGVAKPCGEGRVKFGILSLASMRESFGPPTLRRTDGHFTCRDPDAPLVQVLRPPTGTSVEKAVFGEVRKGYLLARTAVKSTAPQGACSP